MLKGRNKGFLIAIVVVTLLTAFICFIRASLHHMYHGEWLYGEMVVVPLVVAGGLSMILPWDQT